MKSLEIKEEIQGNIFVMRIIGRLDTTTYGMLDARLSEITGSGQTRIVLDCADLEYISSSGLRVFLIALKRIDSLHGKFVLACLREPIRDIMEIAGFTTIFNICSTLTEAVGFARKD